MEGLDIIIPLVIMVVWPILVAIWLDRIPDDK